MSDDFPTFITVAFEDRLGRCEYIRRGLAEKRVDDLQQRISELESVNTEHERQIHKLIQECEKLRERLDAELYGFPCKALEQSDD